MRNKVGLFFAIVLLTVSCTSKPHYVVNGNIEGADSLTFFLKKWAIDKLETIDSAFAVKGSFRMKGGSVKYPQMVLLTDGTNKARMTFFLENNEITVTGKIDSLFNARVEGSKTQDEYDGFLKAEKLISDKYSTLYNDYQLAEQVGDTAKTTKIRNDIMAIEDEITNLQKDFVKTHPASFATPSILAGITYNMEGPEIESYINALDTAVANTEIIKGLRERAMKLRTVATGQKAPDFTLDDPEGKPVSLSSMVGSKLLLIEFWASWCGPCRDENPTLVKIYNEFNKKGFNIFGVSLDRNKEDWVKAISDDKLTWTHVSDLKYWKSAAAQLYAVGAIPANFLLDENGIIIGRNLTGDKLNDKLNEVLGKD